MMAYDLTLQNGQALTLKRLSAAQLPDAAALCDHCAGVNLYPQAVLASVIHRPDHYFYVAVDAARQVVGYLYFYLSDLQQMAAFTKLPVQALRILSPKEAPVIANLCSVGVADAYRQLGLSKALTSYAMDFLSAQTAADAALCVGWKIGDTVPLEKTLRHAGFSYLSDAHRVWYDRPHLICPYCKGRCECAAAVFYKPLHEEESIP